MSLIVYGGPPMARELTDRERGVLQSLIARADDFDQDALPITTEQRARWLADVPTTRAYERCGCGTCPSIVLGDASGVSPSDGPRIVLSAYRGHETLLLFVDNDRLSYLEMFSSDVDSRFDDFPEVAELTY